MAGNVQCSQRPQAPEQIGLTSPGSPHGFSRLREVRTLSIGAPRSILNAFPAQFPRPIDSTMIHVFFWLRQMQAEFCFFAVVFVAVPNLECALRDERGQVATASRMDDI